MTTLINFVSDLRRERDDALAEVATLRKTFVLAESVFLVQDEELKSLRAEVDRLRETVGDLRLTLALRDGDDREQEG